VNLIAIKSCARDKSLHDTIRATWLQYPEVPVHRFFLGQGCAVDHGDELVLDCPDDYSALSEKVREIIRFALARDYDFVFICDADSYIQIPRLLRSGFEAHEYMGCVGDPSTYDSKTMCCSGAGFWLGRFAMQILKDAPVGPGASVGAGCDDWWVFHSLFRAGIFSFNDPRYRANRDTPGQGPAADNDYILLHDSGENSLGRVPQRMIDAHEAARNL
jgi:hypothetical protein